MNLLSYKGYNAAGEFDAEVVRLAGTVRDNTVIRAKSGEEGLRLAAETPVDVVFTDVVMPEMSGLEFAEKLRQQRPGLPVILTTGFSDHIANSGSGGLPVVFKPYRLDTIAEALDKAMRPKRESA